jgi:hypothetical protein
MSLFSATGNAVPFEDMEKPLLAGPFRFLDRIFTGGRVVRAFRLGTDDPAPTPPNVTPDTSR